MTEMTPEREQELIDALNRAGETMPPIMLQLTPQQTCVLIGNLQLALRHPENIGVSSMITRDIVRALISQFPLDAQEALKLGFDPRNDVVPEHDAAMPEPRRCQSCGCTDETACVDPDLGPCWWVEADLCSHCELGLNEEKNHETETSPQ